MKSIASFRISRGLHLFSLLLLSGLLLSSTASAITLTGANGRKVQFHGIKDATPKGITAQMVEDGPLIGITWDKLDLTVLERENALIFNAFQVSQRGETVPLNLGSFDEGGSATMNQDPNAPPKPAVKKSRYDGWLDTSVGGITFLLQLPPGEPRGILFLSAGDDGEAFNHYVWNDSDSRGWGALRNKYQLALLSYEAPIENRDPTVIPELAFANKRSGDHILQAIGKFSIETKKPELVDLPFAVWGSERVGAALAYSFVQWKPERILAAVVSKGAFFEEEPTELSLQVPVLFQVGQYSNNPEIWQSETDAENVFERIAGKVGNWTYGVEFRGDGEPNLESLIFARAYLSEMIALRLPEKKEPEPKEEETSDEEGGPDEETAESPSEEEAEEEMEEEGPSILPYDRSQGLIGNLDTKESRKIAGADEVPGEEETFLPTSEVAKIWAQYANGELEPPAPPPL